jgi:DNA-binding transcriptional LysR family regulator
VELLHHCNTSMDWSDLHLFLAVVRTGSLRRAARSLRLDPSTLSRRLAALERASGARLFERKPSGLLLTSAGKHMVESAERIDLELHALGRRIAGCDERLSGVVRVTMPSSFGDLVSRATAGFVRAHPTIEVELLTLDAMVAIDGREADVAVRVADAPPEHLVGRRVAALAGALYASRAYLVEHPEPLDAPAHGWVLWDRRLAAKPAFGWVEERYPIQRTAARGLTTADVLHAVRAGVGVGLLPCLVADPEASLVRLVDAPRNVWPRVWLLTHRELRPTARVRVYMEWLAHALRLEKARIEGDTSPAPPLRAAEGALARRAPRARASAGAARA